jgi:hypothetical protein
LQESEFLNADESEPPASWTVLTVDSPLLARLFTCGTSGANVDAIVVADASLGI